MVVSFIGILSCNVYHISSQSMEPTLKKGDIIFTVNRKGVNKILLRSVLSGSYNIGSSTNTSFARRIERNSILTFLIEEDSKDILIKRCVGLPGDKMRIVDLRQSDNNELLSYLYFCSNSRFRLIPLNINESFISSVRDDIIIPYEGYELESNMNLFCNNSKHEVTNNMFDFNSYTFLTDYVFLTGDNTEFSKDSRDFGFIPEEQILGTAKIILFSIDRSTTYP